MNDLEVAVKKDLACACKCSLCKRTFNGKSEKNHFVFTCKKCITTGFICCDCMSKEIVETKLCDEALAFFALDGEKILCFEKDEVKVMIQHGDVAVTKRDSGGTALTYTK